MRIRIPMAILRSRVMFIVLALPCVCALASASTADSSTAGTGAGPEIRATLCGPVLSPLVGSQPTLPWLDGPVADNPPARIVSIPAGPRSATLVAAGLICLGAFGSLRSLKRSHLGSTPEWYSTSGPKQVGHATPIDLEFPVRVPVTFESVTIEPVLAIIFNLRIPIAIRPPTTSPRGPPCGAA